MKNSLFCAGFISLLQFLMSQKVAGEDTGNGGDLLPWLVFTDHPSSQATDRLMQDYKIVRSYGTDHHLVTRVLRRVVGKDTDHGEEQEKIEARHEPLRDEE